MVSPALLKEFKTILGPENVFLTKRIWSPIRMMPLFLTRCCLPSPCALLPVKP